MSQLLALSELQLVSVGIVLVVKVECWLTLLFGLVILFKGYENGNDQDEGKCLSVWSEII